MTRKNAPAWEPLPDALWERLEALILARDPQTTGRKRRSPRLILDTLLYREITGCPWNRLPPHLADDSTAYRTRSRWIALGLLDDLYAVIVGVALPA